MRYRISPLRYTLESVLDLFGLGPRRSRFTPARHPESRVRFAQYLNRIQPAGDHHEADRRVIHFLSGGGSVSRGIVRHAPADSEVSPVRTPAFRFAADPGHLAALRRARAQLAPHPFRMLLHALHLRQ